MKRTATPEQKAAAEQRKAKFRSFAAQIANLSDEERATTAAKMPAIMTIEGRQISLHNQLLIALQCPTATIVGGFRQWIKAGRCVKKGEHGLNLWVPSSKRSAENEAQDAQAETFFIIGTVFDVSQTAELSAETEQSAADPTPPQRAPQAAEYYSEEFTPIN